jgi:integrase
LNPNVSPHDLRHRRISLWHRQGVDWARIGDWAGQRSLSTTADRYTHVLLNDAEIRRGLVIG